MKAGGGCGSCLADIDDLIASAYDKPEPTIQQIRYSWFINSLDVGTSIYAINNRNNLVESNIILWDRPEEWEFLALKLTTVPIAHSNLDTHELKILNSILTFVVARNLYLINTNE